MKTFLAVLFLVLGLGIVSGCEPKDERSARRVEMRNQTIQRNMVGLQDDWETFWLMDEPLHLNRWEGP